MAAENTSQIEASIIGTLIMYPEMFATASKVLIPSKVFTGHKMFREQAHIWDFMVDTQLNKIGWWDIQIVSAKFGDVSELIGCAEPESLNSQVLYLREEYQRRVDQKIYADAIQRLTTDSPYSVTEDVLSMLSNEEPEVQEKSRGQEMYEALQSLQSGEAATKTLWAEFNSYTGGIRRGNNYIFAGAPGCGKTERALQMLIDLAKKGKPCAFFSLELTKESIWHRIYHIESGLSMETLSNMVFNEDKGKEELVLSVADANKLADAVKTIANIPLYVHDVIDVGDSVRVVMQKIRWYQRNMDLFCFCVDYVQLLKTGDERIDYRGITTRVDMVSSELSKFSKRTKIAGCWISKLSRDIMTRGGTYRPRSSDLFGSSSLEYEADVISFFHRPGAYENYHAMEKEDGTRYNIYDTEMIITKNRPFGGKVGSFWLLQEEPEKSWLSKDLVPDFSAHRMPSVDHDDDLPF